MSVLACLFAIAVSQGAPKAETALISDASVIHGGVPFTVALQIKMPPTWHTYYLNPGEAGQATEIAWKLPPGFTAGPIQWPVPERTDFQGIASFVYDGEAWLLTTITPPRLLPPGPCVLSAQAKWLLCSTGCVPQSSSLKLALKAGPAVVPNAAEAANFVKARQALPSAPMGFTVVAVSQPKAVLIEVSGATDTKNAQFIPADADAFGANEVKIVPTRGALSLLLASSSYAKSLPKRMKGILILSSSAGSKAYSIDVPVIQR